MFTESLLDYSAGRARRGWSTLVAWTLQTTLIALAILLPLLQTNAVPRVVGVLTPIGAPPGPAAPKSAQPIAHTTSHVQPNPIVRSDQLTEPPIVPKEIDRTPDAVRPGDIANQVCEFCVPGGIPGGGNSGPGFLAKLIPQPTEVAPPPPKPVTRLKVSVLSQGYLLHQVQPIYPTPARIAHIEGTVVLAALINREGTIEGLRAMSGPAMLIGAAMEAVKQWRYKPYVLNGQPVEVETQISVIFTLSH